MAAITTYDGLISRINAGYGAKYNLWYEQEAASVTPGGNLVPMHLGSAGVTLPALPTGVSQYFVTKVTMLSSTAAVSWMIGKLVALATFNNGTNTFTDVASMPTVTELGTSRTASSPILCYVTTATNSNAGSLTVTYVDQDGNTAEAAAAFAMPNSAPSGSAWWLTLNSADWGAQDITNITRSGGASHAGAIVLAGLIPIALMPSPATTLPMTENLLTSGFNMVKLGGSDALIAFTIGSTAAKCIIGDIMVVGDST